MCINGKLVMSSIRTLEVLKPIYRPEYFLDVLFRVLCYILSELALNTSLHFKTKLMHALNVLKYWILNIFTNVFKY